MNTPQAFIRCLKASLLYCLLFVLCPNFALAQIDSERVLWLGRNALYFDDYLTAIRYFNQVIEAKPFLPEAYYYRAYAKFTLEDFHGAEEDCTLSLSRNPYRTEVYRLRGLCRIHNGNFSGAVDDYSYSLREEPDDQGAMYNRALCRIELKDYTAADRELEQILRRWRTFYRAYLVRAQVALESRDTLKAIFWADSLLRLTPNEADAWVLKGRYALQKEEYAQADSFLTRAITLNPKDFDNYLARAQARNALNRFDAALADYDRVVSLVPRHFVAHYNRGLLRALVGDDNRAIEDFGFVLEQEPDNTSALYNRAQLLEQTGDYRRAIADYSRLIALYPNFTYGYYARSRCRRRIGDIRGALNDETVVAKAELDLRFGNNRRRPIKKVRLRSDKALENYQQLIEEEPDTTHSFLGELFGKVQNRQTEQKLLPTFVLAFETGQENAVYSELAERINERKWLADRIIMTTGETVASIAAKTGRRAVDVERINGQIARLTHFELPEALLLRASLLQQTYNYEEALHTVEQCLKQTANNADALLLRATIRLKMAQATELERETMAEKSAAAAGHSAGKPIGDTTAEALLKAALEDADRAVTLLPKSAIAVYNRGCIEAEMGRTKAATEDFSRAIDLDIHLGEAYFNRGVLRLLSGDTQRAIPDLSTAGELGIFRAYNLLKQASKKEGQ